MSEIQQLLKADADNVKNCVQLFQNFSPELSQALEDGALFYSILFRVLSKKLTDDDDQHNIDAADNKKNHEKGDFAKSRIWSRRARATLLLTAYRGYMWAATDIYRTRITSSMNHLRQQIEAAFYMNLILNNPSVGKEWFYAGNKEGKKFYRKYNSKLKEFLDKYKLANTYNRISGTASHTRLTSLIYGLEINSTAKEGRYIDTYTVKMQEVSQDKPEQFILSILAFLTDQIKIFDVLLSSLPEFDDSLLRETRLPLLKSKISRLFSLFNKKFPQMVKEIQKEIVNPDTINDTHL